MKIYLIYFTESGRNTCCHMEQALTEVGHSCKSSEGRGLPGGLSAWTKEVFTSGEALIFVSAAGIAVRAIAPFVQSKTTDPAVIVTDERGRFVISLLSGHMGGANELAVFLAGVTGGQSVITTATDINGRFAVDQWAKKQRLWIWDMKLAKEVSAALLRGEIVGFHSEFHLEGTLPEGLSRMDSVGLGIAVADQKRQPAPYPKTLWLQPRRVMLGIGCRRGVSAERIRQAAEAAFSENGLALGTVVRIASIDLKQDEQGIMDFAEQLDVPFETHSVEALCQADCGAALLGGFSPSGFVKSVTGVDNVCERAAAVSARNAADAAGNPGEGVRLLIRKTARDGVTIAAAVSAAEPVLLIE